MPWAHVFDRGRAGYSPDRLDALVWALTELMVDQPAGMGVFEYYRQGAEKLRNEQGAAKIGHLVTPTNGVKIKMPAGVSNVTGFDGRSYIVGADGTIVAHPNEVAPLTAMGAQRVELEISKNG